VRSRHESPIPFWDTANLASQEKKLEALPYVESEYTRRFKFDSADNPELEELRQRCQLDAVAAAGRDEFDRQVYLLDWVHHRFRKFGRPSVEAKGALEILQAIDQGQAFFCSHYAHVFVSAAASLGWIDRELALRRHRDSPGGGSSEHSTTEIWSNQYRKWVMMDPTAKQVRVHRLHPEHGPDGYGPGLRADVHRERPTLRGHPMA
jgi:transglutaminase-like putative cysteine protease